MDSTTVPGLRIREAVKQDTAVILARITELAEYENLAHEVTATQGQLEEALFGARPFAEVMIAEYEGESVGFALYFHNFSTFLGRPGMDRPGFQSARTGFLQQAECDASG